MSQAIYNGVRMVISKTEHFGFGPVTTEDGVDILTTEIDLAITAIVNVAALATNGPGKQAGSAAPALEDAPAPGITGDSLGVTLANLRAMLLQPRCFLQFSIGGDSVVSIAGPDSNNGPMPQRDTRVRWIAGTATAQVYFHVKAWTVDFVASIKPSVTARVVLANRYASASSMDQDYWTTRHVYGQMIVDAGQLANKALVTPDAFRQAAFLPVPQGFKRDNVQVTVSTDGTRLDYSYTDTETPLALGPRSQCTRVEGNCTAGQEDPLANLSAVGIITAAAASAVFSLASKFAPGVDIAGFGARLATLSIPRVKANAIVRLWGSRNTKKQDLLLLGVNILADRFAPIAGAFFNGKVPRYASLYVTQDISERFLELRAEFIPTLAAVFGGLGLQPADNLKNIMRLTTEIETGSAANTDDPLKGDGTGVNPLPPNSGGTRGNWLGAMVAALLSAPGTLPALPASANVVDQPAFS